MAARGRSGRARRRGKPSRRSRTRSRRRRWVGLSVALLVLALGGLLHLHVTTASLFEGRLWKLPSRVYSDVLVLRTGDPLVPAQLIRRLDRSGYGRTAERPTRAGQYRSRPGRIELHLRSFKAVGYDVRPRSVELRIDDGRLTSITDGRGRRAGPAVIEPELLATLHGPRQEERRPVRLEQVPRDLRAAVLAAEDARFFSHGGLDLRGILRAAWANLRHGKIVQGGSTITQQTVKNLYLHEERTWWRKSREALISLLLDARYSKERIFEVYLNEVYMGQRGPVAVCGVQAASRYYFGRDIADLSLAESALLSGLIRSPGRYNPFRHPERAVARRDRVLDAMERLALISHGKAAAARAEKLDLASGSGGFSRAPHAVDFVRAQLGELYTSETLAREGLEIHTTLDTSWQEHAEQAILAGLDRLERDVPRLRKQRSERTLQGAVVVTDPRSGAILAMVGGRDYEASQFNRAVQARRQPGSCFKPFVFAAGFERAVRGGPDGLTPASLLDDSPIELRSGSDIWRPANHDGRHRGRVTVRRTLEQSLNVPTVRAARQIGLERVIDVARRSGIGSPLASVPSLALGTAEVTPLELAAAYASLARMGEHVPPWIIREVTDGEGVSLKRRRLTRTQAISAQAAFLVNDILEGVVERGTARSASAHGFEGRAAGKTGTTDETRDAWFVGYTRELLALVWVGYDDNARTGLTGATGALPVWSDLMRRAGRSTPRKTFERPQGIIERRIDPATGGLALRGCPQWIDERFAGGSEPTAPCIEHERRFRRWFRKLLDGEGA